jgi:hypothetical protein
MDSPYGVVKGWVLFLWGWISAVIQPEWFQGIKVTDIAIALFALVQLFIYARQTKVMQSQLDIIKQQTELATNSLVLERVPSLEVISAKLWRFESGRKPAIEMSIRTDGYFDIKLFDYRAFDMSLFRSAGRRTKKEKPRFKVTPQRFIKEALWGVADGLFFGLTKAYSTSQKISPGGLPFSILISVEGDISPSDITSIRSGIVPFSLEIYLRYSILHSKIEISRNFTADFKHETEDFEVSAGHNPGIIGKVPLPGDRTPG